MKKYNPLKVAILAAFFILEDEVEIEGNQMEDMVQTGMASNQVLEFATEL
ncbi:hypothetical protein [Paenibacillus sp. JNUCC31]|nr:hypothetical protein [Paenibacillus sp. JNUCC-31]